MLSEPASIFQRPSIGLLLCLSGALVFGALLRLQTSADPLWLDELHTAWCVSGEFAQVSPRATMGNQSPFFFWMVFPVFHAWDETEIALRSLSLCASVALLLSIAVIVARLTRSAGAVVAAVGVAAIDDSFVFFATEARPYVLVQLVAVWQLFFMIRCLPGTDQKARDTRRNLMGLVLTSVALFYLHYTTILLLAAEALVAAVFWLSKRPKIADRRLIALVAIAFLIAALIGLPGILHLLAISRHRHHWESMIDFSSYWYRVFAIWSIYVFLPLAWLIWFRKHDQQWLPQITYGIFVLAVCSLVIPIVAAAATATGLAPLAVEKFTIASSTATVLLVGVSMGIPTSTKTKWIASFMVLALATVTNPLLVAWYQTGVFPRQRDEDWQWVVQKVAQDSRPVFVFPSLVEDGRFASEPSQRMERKWSNYYLFPVNGIYSIDRSDRLVASFPLMPWKGLRSAEWEEMIDRQGGWLIIRAWQSDVDRVCAVIQEQVDARNRAVEFEILSGQPLFLIRIELR